MISFQCTRSAKTRETGSSLSIRIFLLLLLAATTAWPAAAGDRDLEVDRKPGGQQTTSTDPPTGEDDEVDPNPSGAVYGLEPSESRRGPGHGTSSAGAASSDAGPWSILGSLLRSLSSSWRGLSDR